MKTYSITLGVKPSFKASMLLLLTGIKGRVNVDKVEKTVGDGF